VPRLVRVESGHRIGGLWPGFTFVGHLRGARKRLFVENMLLEQFEPEINHRRNKRCDHLRENQAPTMTRPSGRRKSANFVQPLDESLHYALSMANSRAIVEATGCEIDRADNRLKSVSD
jgi:hypothetical protein